MVVFTIIVGLFGIIGVAFGVRGFFYGRRQAELARHQTELARRQTEMMEKDINDRKKQDAEDDQWAERFESLCTKLRRISPHMQVQEPRVLGTTWIYTAMYSDPKFRVDVESYIVQLDPAGTRFLPRKPQPHELRLLRMRETIEKAEGLMEAFIREHPFCKQHLFG